SLFAPGGKLTDATRDLRAAEVGDIVTIVVADSASAVSSGATKTSRKSTVSSNINSAFGPTSTRFANLLGTSGDTELNGTGQTSRNSTLSTTLSARVAFVTPNGSLVLEGTKDIAVNSEKQTITLRGMIRPTDLTVTNTIRSDQVANLSIQ